MTGNVFPSPGTGLPDSHRLTVGIANYLHAFAGAIITLLGYTREGVQL